MDFTGSLLSFYFFLEVFFSLTCTNYNMFRMDDDGVVFECDVIKYCGGVGEISRLRCKRDLSGQVGGICA